MSRYVIVVFLLENCGPKRISSQMSKSQCQTVMLSSSNTTSILTTILQVERSKNPSGKQLTSCSVDAGDLVYLYSDRNKSKARNHYLVISVEGDWCNIGRFSGSQLCCCSYCVKRTECYKVLSDLPNSNRFQYESDSSDEDDPQQSLANAPPGLPVIPTQIVTPPILDTLQQPSDNLIASQSTLFI